MAACLFQFALCTLGSVYGRVGSRTIVTVRDQPGGERYGALWEGSRGERAGEVEQGGGAVAARVFVAGAELGAGEAEVGRDEEERVVAEAVVAAGDQVGRVGIVLARDADAAVERATGFGDDGAVGCGEAHAADKPGGALLECDGDEFAQNAGVVGGVALGAREASFAAVGGVVRGDDAGAAVEGVDLEAGVVGEAVQAGLCGVGTGLDTCVVGEGGAGLGGFDCARDGGVGKCEQTRSGEEGRVRSARIVKGRGDDRAEFIDLMRVGGSEEEVGHG